MKLRDSLKIFQAFICLAIVALMLASIPTAAAKDKRGKSRDKSEKKEEKFINGHDARDGRWDGRGPRKNRGRNDCDHCDDDFSGKRRNKLRRR